MLACLSRCLGDGCGPARKPDSEHPWFASRVTSDTEKACLSASTTADIEEVYFAARATVNIEKRALLLAQPRTLKKMFCCHRDYWQRRSMFAAKATSDTEEALKHKSLIISQKSSLVLQSHRVWSESSPRAVKDGSRWNPRLSDGCRTNGVSTAHDGACNGYYPVLSRSFLTPSTEGEVVL